MTTPDPYNCGDPVHAGMSCDEFDASLEEDLGRSATPDPAVPPLWTLETS
jgi:hypothetical protein